MHNAAFAELGLNLAYLAFDVDPGHLAAALTGTLRMQFVGVNLTVPHKLLAVGLMDELDASARKWGAVNTVCFEGRTGDGAWAPMRELDGEVPSEVRSKGYNTDAYGLAASLREDLGIRLAQARVVLLGAGGVGRVAALQLAEEGVSELFLVNRTLAKAEALVAEIRDRFPAVQVLTGYPDREVDLVINATSLGLRTDDPLPIDLDQFPLTEARAVYDMVYRPAETRLLEAAGAAGARSVNGLGMLLHQGARAFELWTGQPAPITVMKAALHKEVYER
jgi:shikimate dehydrogenase